MALWTVNTRRLHSFQFVSAAVRIKHSSTLSLPIEFETMAVCHDVNSIISYELQLDNSRKLRRFSHCRRFDRSQPNQRAQSSSTRIALRANKTFDIFSINICVRCFDSMLLFKCRVCTFNFGQSLDRTNRRIFIVAIVIAMFRSWRSRCSKRKRSTQLLLNGPDDPKLDRACQ